MNELPVMAMMPPPAQPVSDLVGKMVLYQLTKSDVEHIKAQRAASGLNAKSYPSPNDCFPAVIVYHNAPPAGGGAYMSYGDADMRLQVFLGPDTLEVYGAQFLLKNEVKA